MKRFPFFLIAATLCISMLACKKNNKETDQPKPDEPTELPGGKVTSEGVPDGSPLEQKVIGVAGGTLESNDGKVKVTIPAGALAGDQTVSIQRLTNTNPLRMDSAYRIGPHGVTFSKPVSITFEYSDASLRGTAAEALGVAYRNEKGIWKAISAHTVDKTNKTVTISTTHFSDWAIFKYFELVTSDNILPLSAKAQLVVYGNMDLINKAYDEVPIGERTKLDGKFIKEWGDEGHGDLQSAGADATYTAAATLSEGYEQARFEVRLDGGEKGAFVLNSHIEVFEAVIAIRVNDGPWEKLAAAPVDKFGQLYTVKNNDRAEKGRIVVITWMGKDIGLYPYDILNDVGFNAVEYAIDGEDTFMCFHADEAANLIQSTGGISVTSIVEKNGLVRGTFVVDNAGFGNWFEHTAKIEGRFTAVLTE